MHGCRDGKGKDAGLERGEKERADGPRKKCTSGRSILSEDCKPRNFLLMWLWGWNTGCSMHFSQPIAWMRQHNSSAGENRVTQRRITNGERKMLQMPFLCLLSFFLLSPSRKSDCLWHTQPQSHETRENEGREKGGPNRTVDTVSFQLKAVVVASHASQAVLWRERKARKRAKREEKRSERKRKTERGERRERKKERNSQTRPGSNASLKSHMCTLSLCLVFRFSCPRTTGMAAILSACKGRRRRVIPMHLPRFHTHPHPHHSRVNLASAVRFSHLLPA